MSKKYGRWSFADVEGSRNAAFFSLAVALIPMAAGLYDSGERTQPDSELGGLARMFAVLLLIEVASLMGNYY